MTRKTIISITGIVLLATAVVFAAEKAKEKKEADKPEQQAQVGETQKQRENLLDQLINAYKADDKKAMGEIITKMEQRRDKMREAAKLRRWHRREHRRMDRQGRGCGMRGGFAPRCRGYCPMGMNNRQRPRFDGRPMPGGRGFGQRQGWIPSPAQGDVAPPAADLEPDDHQTDEISTEEDLPDISVADLFSETDW
ncbi:MAG: hypothetical protein JW749_06745 [Sedimentisphaerales bacterium]|nr:hypothetical protein [Sedimentisphaerales bacterium]